MTNYGLGAIRWLKPPTERENTYYTAHHNYLSQTEIFISSNSIISEIQETKITISDHTTIYISFY